MIPRVLRMHEDNIWLLCCRFQMQTTTPWLPIRPHDRASECLPSTRCCEDKQMMDQSVPPTFRFATCSAVGSGTSSGLSSSLGASFAFAAAASFILFVCSSTSLARSADFFSMPSPRTNLDSRFHGFQQPKPIQVIAGIVCNGAFSSFESPFFSKAWKLSSAPRCT